VALIFLHARPWDGAVAELGDSVSGNKRKISREVKDGILWVYINGQVVLPLQCSYLVIWHANGSVTVVGRLRRSISSELSSYRVKHFVFFLPFYLFFF
jgi:hypothetical protein